MRSALRSLAVIVSAVAAAGGALAGGRFPAYPGLAKPGIFVGPGQGTVDAWRKLDDSFFEHWWHLNQEQHLDLRRRLFGANAARGVSGDTRAAALARLRTWAGPESANEELRSAALAALAKAGDADAGSLDLLLAGTECANQNVQRAALIALGVRGRGDALDFLLDVVRGRGGGIASEAQLRATAAIAVGLLCGGDSLPEAPEPERAGAAASKVPDRVAVALESEIVAPGAVAAIALHPEGRTVAVALAAGEVRFWPVAQRQFGAVKLRSRGGAEVRALAFHPDGARIALALADGTVELWDWTLRTAKDPLVGHAAAVTALAFDPGRGRIATGSVDGSVRTWLLNRGAPLHVLLERPTGVTALAWSGAGEKIAAGFADGAAYVLELRPGATREVARFDAAISALTFSGDGSRLAVGSERGEIALASCSGGAPVALTASNTGAVDALAFAERAGGVLAGTGGGHGAFIDLELRREVFSWETRGEYFATAADGSAIACSAADGALRHWKVEAAELPPRAAGGAAALAPPAARLGELLARRAFEELPETVQNAVALAAGIGGQGAFADPLAKLLKPETKLNQRVRANLILALAKCGGPDVFPYLFQVQADGKMVERIAAALGLAFALEGQGDGQQGARLEQALFERIEGEECERDALARQFLYLALGRLGRERGVEWLRAAVAAKQGDEEIFEQPFQAYALGVADATAAAPLLGEVFARQGNVHYRCALAAACGLLGPQGSAAAPALRAELASTSNRALAAFTTLALGMMGDAESLSAMRRQLGRTRLDVEALPLLAVGVALGGGRETVEQELIGRLARGGGGSEEQEVLLFGLGLVGGEQAARAILAHSGNRPAEVRAYAAQALGEILDPRPRSPYARLRAYFDVGNAPEVLLAGGLLTFQ